MKQVVTTEQSQVLGVVIAELGRIVPAGVLFECTDSRFEVLSGRNGYHAIFVREAGKEPAVAEVVEAIKEEEPAAEVAHEEPVIECEEEACEPVEEVHEETAEETPAKKKKKK